MTDDVDELQEPIGVDDDRRSVSSRSRAHGPSKFDVDARRRSSELSVIEDGAEWFRPARGALVDVVLPYRNGTGELEDRTFRGHVLDVVGGAMAPIVATVGLVDVEATVTVNATRERLIVRGGST